MTTRKTGSDKGGARKLKLKKETLKDLDVKGGKKVKAGAVLRFDDSYGCTNYGGVCASTNMFCHPMTGAGCQTLNCTLPTFAFCAK